MSSSEVVITPLPYTSRIDRRGDIRMSSHTALVTDATASLYRQNPNARIFIPGESTFGTEYPSTADLMKEQLIKKGVPAGAIETQDNLNDTESQLNAIKERGITKPTIVDMEFHNERVNVLREQLGLQGKTIVAETIILQTHKGATPQRLKKFAATRTTMAGISKVYFAETIGRTGARLGAVGKAAVNVLRRFMKAEGATVTDYHYVGSAKQHFKEAMDDTTQMDRYGRTNHRMRFPIHIKRERLLAQKKKAA